MERVSFSNSPDHALVAYLVKKYNEAENGPALGRTILQKLCYLARAQGVPFTFQFDIHHYGPFCAELFSVAGDLIADRVICGQNSDFSSSRYVPGPACEQLLRRKKTFLEKSKTTLDQMVSQFGEMSTQELELITTIHYVYCAAGFRGKSKREFVVNTVRDIKRDKFPRNVIRSMFDELDKSRLLAWNPSGVH